MSSQTSVVRDVSRLVEFPKGLEVLADDTLESFHQVLRLQAILDDSGRLDHLQLLLDRRHKVKPSLSKPLGYLHLSTANQLLNLAAQGIVGACLLALKDQPTDERRISQTVNGIAGFLLQDAKRTVQVMLEEMERRK